MRGVQTLNPPRSLIKSEHVPNMFPHRPLQLKHCNPTLSIIILSKFIFIGTIKHRKYMYFPLVFATISPTFYQQFSTLS